jgi:hypothetical protein
MIVTRTSGSRSCASSVVKISARNALFSALRFSGRFSVMRRTPAAGASIRMCVGALIVVSPSVGGRSPPGIVRADQSLRFRSGA